MKRQDFEVLVKRPMVRRGANLRIVLVDLEACVLSNLSIGNSIFQGGREAGKDGGKREESMKIPCV